MSRIPTFKTCKACGFRGRVDEDFYVWKAGDGRHLRVSARCRECHRQASRERYARVMSDPYLRRLEAERKRNWEAEQRKRAANPERCRRYREKLKAERPSVYRQQLEDSRLRSGLRREEAGKPTTTKRTRVVNGKSSHLPLAPLVEFLERAQSARPWIEDDPSKARAIYRITHETERVSVRVVEDVLAMFDMPLALVYPEALESDAV
jgi:hypothetical protein